MLFSHIFFQLKFFFKETIINQKIFKTSCNKDVLKLKVETSKRRKLETLEREHELFLLEHVAGLNNFLNNFFLNCESCCFDSDLISLYLSHLSLNLHGQLVILPRIFLHVRSLSLIRSVSVTFTRFF